MNPKQRAAEAALAFVKDGMVVGLGTGSTSDFFHKALAREIKEGRLRDIKGVPTSRHAEAAAVRLGIPLVTFAQSPRIDVTVDGADEIDPELRLIKGLGGALLREKIVAQNSARMVVIADASKTSARLGTKSPLPVEVTPFGFETHEAFLRSLGATPTLRRKDDAAFVTDNGNYIYDCKFQSPIADPVALEAKLKGRAGVVETGLFIGIAAVTLVADEDRVEERHRVAH
jgi:ribose 5-phosphate isomerase A